MTGIGSGKTGELHVEHEREIAELARQRGGR
jgi:hypothetical protein